MTSVRMDTMARYARFVRGLMASPSMEVVVMCSVAKRTSVVSLEETLP